MSQFAVFPNLFTPRLALRQLKTDDGQALVALRSDDVVNRYLDRPKAVILPETCEFINKINSGIIKNELFYWAITLINDDKLIGTICYWNINADRSEAEIGYELDPEYHGKGLMREAMAKVIEYGFQTASFKVITAYTNVDNHSSIKLLERTSFNIDQNLTNKHKNDEEYSNLLVYSLFNNA